jgi:glycosyltransferase involved in cell wall biosynthesis
VPAAEFFHLASRATVGVVTLRSDIIRSAGQQTYLNLLSMGVPVVVNDAPGVREHLEDIPGAFIIPPDDAEALRRRVAWLIDEENRAIVEEMVRAGKTLVDERFGPAAYLKRLVSLAQVEESDYR